MKIVITMSSEKFLENNDYRNFYEIMINGEKMRFLDGEPEDANLSRNFKDIYSFPKWLVAAHSAGLRGEPIDIVKKEIDDWE